MDMRSNFERALDEHLGRPLYYCASCQRGVKVTAVEGAPPQVDRPCGPECGEQIIAPRKAIVAGEGGLNLKDRAILAWWQTAAALTGRCV